MGKLDNYPCKCLYMQYFMSIHLGKSYCFVVNQTSRITFSLWDIYFKSSHKSPYKELYKLFILKSHYVTEYI